jgi:hypothetical protein
MSEVRRKYGNVPAVYAGERYDSTGEARYAAHLDVLKAAGLIHDWRRGREWVLLDAPRRADRITYRPDFEVWPLPDRLEVRDFKGVATREFRLKAKLWKAVYPTIALYVVGADGAERRV